MIAGAIGAIITGVITGVGRGAGTTLGGIGVTTTGSTIGASCAYAFAGASKPRA